jgi:hypothetical protein
MFAGARRCWSAPCWCVELFSQFIFVTLYAGVVVDILHDSCHYIDFNLCDGESDAKPASAVTPVAALKIAASTSRDELDIGPREPLKETDKTRVMFKPALVARLGAVARKLLEVVDIIQRSSSPELAQFTEIWKIQWHFEATMFIENRLEMQDSYTYYSLAACNRWLSNCNIFTMAHDHPHTLHHFQQHLLHCCRRCAATCTLYPARPPLRRIAADF